MEAAVGPMIVPGRWKCKGSKSLIRRVGVRVGVESQGEELASAGSKEAEERAAILESELNACQSQGRSSYLQQPAGDPQILSPSSAAETVGVAASGEFRSAKRLRPAISCSKG